MLRVLLIDDTPRKVGRLRTALIEAGFEVIEESGLTIDLPERVEQSLELEALRADLAHERARELEEDDAGHVVQGHGGQQRLDEDTLGARLAH